MADDTRHPTTPARTAAGVLAGVGVLILVSAAVGRFVPADGIGRTDFIEYGAAARLLAGGRNPYDGRAVLEVQRAVGSREPAAVMMWNPPWVLPLVLPLAAVPWPAGLVGWILVQLAAVLTAAAWSWHLYGGPDRLRGLAFGVALLFAPTVLLLRMGQLPGVMVFGLVAFLVALRADRPGLAGLAAALTAVKPHLLLPFAALLACDAVVNRATRRAVLAGAAALLGLAAVATAVRPGVWREYTAAVNAPSDEYHKSPADWQPPTLAYHFRAAVGGGLNTQFIPAAVATAGLVAYWCARRRVWDWEAELPRVVLVSVLVSGYGAWVFDLVVLLLPVVQATVWVARRPGWAGYGAVAGFVGLNLWAVATYRGPGSVPGEVWWAPAAAAYYLLCGWLTREAVGTPGQPG
jgi:hypothetical protein